jgi:FMN phosphatase YigB (HAD superfamily)
MPSRPPLALVVLDFDGTFTLVDEEAASFLEGFRADLSVRVGRPLDDLFAEVEAEVKAAPERFGWEHEGRIVAPAHADPYVLASTVGQGILERVTDLDGVARRAVLDALYRTHYPRSGCVFRPDAKAVAEALLAGPASVAVVTNSLTAHVEAKLDALDPEGRERLAILGDAKKFVVAEGTSPRIREIPETLSLPGLPRPVYLHRGLYLDVLEALMAQHGARPETTLVCGDIYELDLAMPAALGMRVHHVARPDTPVYEREAVVAAGGTRSVALAGLLDVL